MRYRVWRVCALGLASILGSGQAVQAQIASGYPVWSSGELVRAEPQAATMEGTLESAVRFMLLPPSEFLSRLGARVDQLLPGEAEVLEVVREDSSVVVRLALPAEFLATEVDDELLEKLSRQLLLGLDPWAIRKIHLTVRDLDYEGPGDRFLALPAFLNIEPVPVKEEEEGVVSSKVVIRSRGRSGGLTGKLIFISQAHGWIDYGGATGWSTQRGVTHGIVEDFVNAEAIDQYLLRYLEGAGADVFTAREPDPRAAMVIVDDGDADSAPGNGIYFEFGDTSQISDDSQAGFANFAAPYSSGTDPFEDTGGSARLITTSVVETAGATWIPVIPHDGDYQVSVSYTRDGTQRASDAHYRVAHTGGISDVYVNQERHGWTWVPLGRFHFRAGADAARGSVSLLNDSTEPGQTVAADAVRFGGGVGDVLGHETATLSGRPRWEEGARTHVQYLGAPPSVYTPGDVTARSRWADYEHFAGEDSVYVSWHSNAFDGSARGTSSYIYSSNPPDGTYDPTQSVTGSAALMEAIHDEIINDVTVGWDPNWVDRGYRSAYFGEINPAHNDEMPSALLEVAFHDNATDAEALAHPRFRKLLARAVYQGIARYFAERDGETPTFLPEEPLAPWVRSSRSNSVTVGWQAPSTDDDGLRGGAATGYRVYTSPDGKGFDDGTPTSETSLVLEGLSPAETLYVRVTATNAGGESLPTETLAVRTQAADEETLLLVGGFDRLDASMLIPDNVPGLGTVQRMDLDRMNRFDLVAVHAAALAGVGVAIDSASNDAVESGSLALEPYAAVIWGVGLESTADQTLSPLEQSLLTAYLSTGGKLALSGAEIGWDLDHLGSAADRDFYHLVLKSRYVADDAGLYGVEAPVGSPFDGIGVVSFDDGSHGGYDVRYPDVLAAESGAEVSFDYSGSADGAAVVFDGGEQRILNFGFPLDAIYSLAQRSLVLQRALEFFGLDASNLFRDGFESGGLSAWSATQGARNRVASQQNP